MESIPLTNHILFNNVLYIGDEPKECISVLKKFNNCLYEIERRYQRWFDNRRSGQQTDGRDKLQHHIQYHFEGGVAVFKFKNDDALPEVIRKECLSACRNIAVEQQLQYS